jgi:hypothetical protein
MSLHPINRWGPPRRLPFVNRYRGHFTNGRKPTGWEEILADYIDGLLPAGHLNRGRVTGRSHPTGLSGSDYNRFVEEVHTGSPEEQVTVGETFRGPYGVHDANQHTYSLRDLEHTIGYDPSLGGVDNNPGSIPTLQFATGPSSNLLFDPRRWQDQNGNVQQRRRRKRRGRKQRKL